MNKQYLFNEEIDISGLIYISNYISLEYAGKSLKLIDTQEWNLDLKRRTQHYGYKYDYTARSLESLSQRRFSFSKKCMGKKPQSSKTQVNTGFEDIHAFASSVRMYLRWRE